MSEPVRMVLGFSVAALLPAFVPALDANRVRAAAAAALIGLWTLLPSASEPAAWVLLAAVTALQLVVVRQTAPLVARGRVGRLSVVAAAAAAVGAAAAVLTDASGTADVLVDALESDRGLLVTLALLVAIFPAGALIGELTAPWARAVEAELEDEPPRGLEGAGRYIGWLERGAVFWAIVLGRPEAVAVIFTAKSIARFPSFSRESFAEYYLIGTLLSVLGGAAVAVATRMLLGLDPIGD